MRFKPAPDRRLADADGHLRVAQRLRQMRQHGGFGLGLEVEAQVIEERIAQRTVEPGLVDEHDGLHRIEAVETGDLLRGRRCGRRDRQGAGLRVELQARKLPVEGIDVGGGRAVAFAGLGLVAQGLVGAAQPVVGAGPAQGTVG